MPTLQIYLNNGNTLSAEISYSDSDQLLDDYAAYLEGKSVPARRLQSINPAGTILIAISAIQAIEAVS